MEYKTCVGRLRAVGLEPAGNGDRVGVEIERTSLHVTATAKIHCCVGRVEPGIDGRHGASHARRRRVHEITSASSAKRTKIANKRVARLVQAIIEDRVVSENLSGISRCVGRGGAVVG